ncbi:hypothetical protein EPK99_06420 [Neorhizobium lilium]|uniref:Uncharacterized protein n=1 Tax=Neorhizobium lilium TaxID=2503024 RepID=A0A444LGW3_9HYPH|nr:hypothetical protein [Neorhizobium lilium]RWX78263.1 hypothetical protein EPK99_06420 [Neorhizobium lilium]
MRLSSDKDDPGYRDWCILNGDGKLVRVFLDGALQKGALMADDEAGEVRRCVFTPEGNYARGHEEFLTEVVKGKVEILIEAKR